MSLMAASGVAVGAGVAALAPSEAKAQLGLTDNGNGQCTDARGYGRGASGRWTGITDRDNGYTGADLTNHGRGLC